MRYFELSQSIGVLTCVPIFDLMKISEKSTVLRKRHKTINTDNWYLFIFLLFLPIQMNYGAVLPLQLLDTDISTWNLGDLDASVDQADQHDCNPAIDKFSIKTFKTNC